MTDRLEPLKPWLQIAALVAQEKDPEKLAELTDKLLEAMEEEKRQADALATKQRTKFKAA